jgi:flagellar protein FliO/FliZ
MFETLFGAEMPLAVRFFLAFLVVLGLIGLTAWAVRRFGTGRLGGAGARGRQPRLAVIDYASVDGRRRLILVRRDNVEHLLMIGGPTDVVVEPNIVRATAAPRDAATRPTAGLEALPRAIPLPESGSNGSWPLQPEPASGLRLSPRVEPLPDELPKALAPQPASEPPPRPQRDTLAALADELSTRPSPLPRSRPTNIPRPQPAEPRQESRQELRQEVRQDTRQEVPEEPPIEPPAEPRIPMLQPAAAAPIAPTPPVAPPPSASPAPPPGGAEADKNLADMAQRLEAALRKSTTAETRPGPTPPRAAPAAEQGQPTDAAPTMPRPPRPAEPKPPRPEAKAPQGKTALYDSLEQEMASLLGRQTKT